MAQVQLILCFAGMFIFYSTTLCILNLKKYLLIQYTFTMPYRLEILFLKMLFYLSSSREAPPKNHLSPKAPMEEMLWCTGKDFRLKYNIRQLLVDVPTAR